MEPLSTFTQSPAGSRPSRIASDRVFVLIGLSYEWQITVYRVLVFVGPVLAFFLTKRICLELQKSDQIEQRRKRLEAPA